MADHWHELAAKFAARPQPPPPPERDAWLPEPPDWLTPADGLFQARLAWPRLYRDGVVVWGFVFIANNVLWRPGTEDAPAAVVYSFDPAFRRDPTPLRGVIEALGLLRTSTRPAPPGLEATQALVQDDTGRSMQAPVSDRLSWGRAVFLAAVMIHRKHLPVPMLTGLPLPLLACPGPGEPCLVVPAHYWPDALTAAWRGDAASPG